MLKYKYKVVMLHQFTQPDEWYKSHSLNYRTYKRALARAEALNRHAPPSIRAVIFYIDTGKPVQETSVETVAFVVNLTNKSWHELT